MTESCLIILESIRTINLIVGSNQSLCLWMLPIVVIGTLIFSILADYTTPLIQQRFISR